MTKKEMALAVLYGFLVPLNGVCAWGAFVRGDWGDFVFFLVFTLYWANEFLGLGQGAKE